MVGVNDEAGALPCACRQARRIVFRDMRMMLSEYGLTAASRTKVSTVGVKKGSKDPWDDF